MFNNENEVNEFELCNISPEKTAAIMNDKISESFCPVIFLGENTYLNEPSPITESLRTLAVWNTMAVTTGYKKCITPIQSTHELSTLDMADTDLTVYLIKQKILADVYGSFISALDQGMCEKRDLLHYFYIREKVYNLLYEGPLSYKINSIITSAVGSFSSYYAYDKNKMADSQAFLINLSGLLSTTIISAINCGIESAVNDIMYRIHVIPNQNDIERKMRAAFNLTMRVDEGFWIYAANALKTAILNDIDPCLHVITSTCKNTLIDIIYTNSFVYLDACNDLMEKNKLES